ncbi:MAG: histidinol dehydrogenase [Holophagales bacterium]|nr:histidinol dehydrogenase [Holophagales bacterium]MYG31368.1 histidinol dehydrogenase [Holophagales bacterium]MYI78962.1 histidinol dehydrogenase [Holophagales bacterium]
MSEVGGSALRVLDAGSFAGRERLELLDRRGRGGIAAEIRQAAAEIVDQVRAGGDAALLEAVRRFDGYEAGTTDLLRLSVRGSSDPLPPKAAGKRAGREAGSAPAVDEVEPPVLAAIERARSAIEAYHRVLLRGPGVERVDRDGVRIEERRLAVRRVGLYLPGGRFPYPSTVLMTAVPARLAGVEEIVVATPPRAYRDSPVLRHVLDLVGVDEVWGMGGAHAVAALAYGTESIRPVDLIAGPGNAWVAAAKQHVAADVGIDRDAGPSEVVIVATAGAPAECVAADLLAQAEHDPLAVAVLVTDSAELAESVGREVDSRLADLPTAETAVAALERYGVAFVVADLDEAIALAERIAPEHLQLMGEAAEERAGEVRNAGAVFVGASSPVVFGDYVAGPSHVLPTGGSARFASGLGTEDFLRRSHTVRFSAEAAAAWAGAAETLATTEGLSAHAAAAALRRGSDGRETRR